MPDRPKQMHSTKRAARGISSTTQPLNLFVGFLPFLFTSVVHKCYSQALLTVPERNSPRAPAPQNAEISISSPKRSASLLGCSTSEIHKRLKRSKLHPLLHNAILAISKRIGTSQWIGGADDAAAISRTDAAKTRVAAAVECGWAVVLAAWASSYW